jgi:hypothetical protein
MAGNGPLRPSHRNSCVQPRQQAIPEVLKPYFLLAFEAVRARRHSGLQGCFNLPSLVRSQRSTSTKFRWLLLCHLRVRPLIELVRLPCSKTCCKHEKMVPAAQAQKIS